MTEEVRDQDDDDKILPDRKRIRKKSNELISDAKATAEKKIPAIEDERGDGGKKEMCVIAEGVEEEKSSDAKVEKSPQPQPQQMEIIAIKEEKKTIKHDQLIERYSRMQQDMVDLPSVGSTEGCCYIQEEWKPYQIESCRRLARVYPGHVDKEHLVESNSLPPLSVPRLQMNWLSQLCSLILCVFLFATVVWQQFVIIDLKMHLEEMHNSMASGASPDNTTHSDESSHVMPIVHAVPIYESNLPMDVTMERFLKYLEQWSAQSSVSQRFAFTQVLLTDVNQTTSAISLDTDRGIRTVMFVKFFSTSRKYPDTKNIQLLHDAGFRRIVLASITSTKEMEPKSLSQLEDEVFKQVEGSGFQRDEFLLMPIAWKPGSDFPLDFERNVPSFERFANWFIQE